MNELQAALFFGLLSIPFTCALGVKLTRAIFSAVLLLAAVPVLLRRAIRRALGAVFHAIRRAPRAAYDLVDRFLQRWFPPRLEFQVEYSTLDYYVRMSSRSLTLEQYLRTNGCPIPIGGAS